MKIGFTGTQKGMTKAQRSGVSYWLWRYAYLTVNEAHHGDCIGADVEFHYMANNLKCAIFKHPANDVRDYKRAHCAGGTILPVKPALERNHNIVDTVDVMIAAPGQNNQVLRSGTWATIRYAIKINKRIHIILPNGEELHQIRRNEFNDN